MSTNSTIGIRRIDGTESRIYCHWDGYIEGVGITLQIYYNSAELIEQLLKLGNLSSLDKKIIPDSENNFDNGVKDACLPYTVRGEKWEQVPVTQREEYNYTFDEIYNLWFVEYSDYEEYVIPDVHIRFNYERLTSEPLVEAINRKFKEHPDYFDINPAELSELNREVGRSYSNSKYCGF